MPRFAVFAPGRVNLIGEHTDYSGGLVLPVAITLGVTLRGRDDPDGITLRSRALRGEVSLDPDGTPVAELPPWGRYIAAIAGLLAERGRPRRGLEGEIESTVPIGAGLSSSAALSVAVGLALCRVASWEIPALELAHLATQAELRAVGVPCGLMDPATSLLARRGHALLLDCGSERYRQVRLPEELAIVVLDSGTPHALERSGYARRRAELERALAVLSGRRPADLTLPQALAAARDAGLDEVTIARLRHVVTENERVRELVAVLESPAPLDRARLGAIMLASHESLRSDFAVSTPELDTLVELAFAGGALGARMTGGGFGGSVVALVEEARAAELAASVLGAYRSQGGREGGAWVCATSDAAGALEPLPDQAQADRGDAPVSRSESEQES